jgi:DNA-binding PadR family transcriptional regulator
MAVALLIWYRRGLEGTSEGLAISQKMAERLMGIKPRALTRGLRKLRAVGLISTAGGRGKAIRVSILPVPQPQEPPV